jgi:hypothetical protein
MPDLKMLRSSEPDERTPPTLAREGALDRRGLQMRQLFHRFDESSQRREFECVCRLRYEIRNRAVKEPNRETSKSRN